MRNLAPNPHARAKRQVGEGACPHRRYRWSLPRSATGAHRARGDRDPAGRIDESRSSPAGQVDRVVERAERKRPLHSRARTRDPNPLRERRARVSMKRHDKPPSGSAARTRSTWCPCLDLGQHDSAHAACADEAPDRRRTSGVPASLMRTGTRSPTSACVPSHAAMSRAMAALCRLPRRRPRDR